MKIIDFIIRICAAISLLMITIYLLVNCFHNSDTSTPTALDVYRGNTTLRVDYSIIGGDTIPGDTTVMFKSQIIKFEVE